MILSIKYVYKYNAMEMFVLINDLSQGDDCVKQLVIIYVYVWMILSSFRFFFLGMASNLLFHIRNQVKMLHTNFPGPHWVVCSAYTRGEICMGNGCCNKNCLHGHPGKYCLNYLHGHPDILFASRISRQFLMTFSLCIRI